MQTDEIRKVIEKWRVRESLAQRMIDSKDAGITKRELAELDGERRATRLCADELVIALSRGAQQIQNEPDDTRVERDH